ncbi:uroporphyrin-III C-methyltransferase/uroporphyrinogen III methyltransferase / synthase [Evansella caseinilytica]|uniref:Uroporphyrinogen-III C-methyltransferase n=1 Tax=Evansella caseinilytica TaxID=1503961 RepID=A0A1H3V0Y7_9BACI|nr:uroporphyrinogen-III C-methyltransferase [Evansella caseinilytica]SDZ67891.1 uroporphyrin-III C-methyltransferase/uroporphyrinogen III methyltransferase / synthase [Evansella caseinilytica]
MKKGKVYFVGAGPGDPDLITVKGMKAIKAADIIVYDRLVNKELLTYATPLVKLIYCGKLPDRHTIPQREINEILVTYACKGKTVTRLKGGDPNIFGRVGEEAEYCAANGIPFEIVPGITSGIAAAAYAGIPLTHRDLSSSCAFITGHKRTDGVPRETKWDKLATSVDTLVFYMGIGNLRMIHEQLVYHGRSPETPVALIRWGTTEEQETIVGTLRTIADMAEEARFTSPTIIVVGEVVALRKKIAWFAEKEERMASLAQAK